MCKKYVFEYIQMIEEIVQQGIENKEIIEGNPNVIASSVFGFTFSSLIYKTRIERDIKIPELYSEIERTFIRKLKRD